MLCTRHLHTNNTNKMLWASRYSPIPPSYLLPLFSSSRKCMSVHYNCAGECCLICLEKAPQEVSILLCDRDSCVNKTNRVLWVYVCNLVQASYPWLLLCHSNRHVCLQSTLQGLSRPTLHGSFGSTVRLCTRLFAIF